MRCAIAIDPDGLISTIRAIATTSDDLGAVKNSIRYQLTAHLLETTFFKS
jgi:hypothetical protein